MAGGIFFQIMVVPPMA